MDCLVRIHDLFIPQKPKYRASHAGKSFSLSDFVFKKCKNETAKMDLYSFWTDGVRFEVKNYAMKHTFPQYKSDSCSSKRCAAFPYYRIRYSA